MDSPSLKELFEQQTWDDFPPLRDQGLFLQSFRQKQLYEKMGQKSWLFETTTRSGNIIRSLVTKVSARRGTFLFLPYGPMVSGALQASDLESFFQQLRLHATKEGAAFIRVSPFWPEDEEHRQLMKTLGFHPAPLHMLAETLWLLDLEGKSEEDLLAGMDKKHRNLVRRAEKEGVSVTFDTAPEATERFIDLHWQTVSRHGFTPYTKDSFRQQVTLFASENAVQVVEAWWNGALLASAIIMYFGKVAAYHHGASSSDPEHRKIPASYLLQWQIIREAQKRGMKAYNFWGIAPGENPKHPFYGITHFKTGFGGSRYDLLPCQDLPLKPSYHVTRLIETLRKWKRGF